MSNSPPRRPSAARRKAVQSERAARSKVPLLGRTSFDAWADWFAEQDQPFAQAWVELFPGPEQRACGGFVADREAVVALAALAPSARDYFLAEQAEALEGAVTAIRRVDPLHLLSLMLFIRRFQPWGSSQDPADAPDDLDFELACQAVAAEPSTEQTSFAPLDVAAALSQLTRVRLLAHAVNVADMFMPGPSDLGHSDAAAEPTGQIDESVPAANIAALDASVRNGLLARWLVWRGEAYPVHARRLALQLGADRQRALLQRLGFDVADFIAVADGLASLWRDTVSEEVDKALSSVESSISEASAALPQQMARQLGFIAASPVWLTPVVAPTVGALRERLREPTRSRLDAVLAATSLRPGEGPALKSVLDEPAGRDRPFLLFDSPVPSYPDGRRILVTFPGALSTDMVATVESLLSRTFGNRWPAARAMAVDTLAVDLLASKLPGCIPLTSVHVEAPDGSGRFEMDGLVLFDDMALFLEGKGAPFKLAGRRGSVDRYRNQLKDLVGYGAQQLARDARLLEGSPVQLLDRHGTSVGQLDPTQVRRSFQVLPSLDDLGDVGTSLELLDAWRILTPGQTPWIVAVTDMAIVADALRGPAELAAYLEWRQRWVREPRLLITDEIEMFVLFQRAVDLYGALRTAGDDDRAIFASGQPVFDDYYAGRDGTGPVSPQPRVELTRRFSRFVEEISRLRPPGWLGAASAALQAPKSLQVACDQRASERELATAATHAGALVTGDRDFATVMIGPHVSWPDAYREHQLPQRFAASDWALLFRAEGSRLRLEWACRGHESEPPPRWRA